MWSILSIKLIPFTVGKPPVVLNRFDDDREAHAAGHQRETNLTAAATKDRIGGPHLQ
jgi:hypothetical protein